jgi:hypothetical protein
MATSPELSHVGGGLQAAAFIDRADRVERGQHGEFAGSEPPFSMRSRRATGGPFFRPPHLSARLFLRDDGRGARGSG